MSRTHKLTTETLDRLLHQAMEALKGSQEGMFRLAEDARSEHDRIKRDLDDIKQKVLLHIRRVDQLERRLRRARAELAAVNRDFRRHSEAEIKAAYERAEALQVELSVEREREAVLRQRRDELERSLLHLEQMVERAEQLVKQVNMALELLMGNLENMLAEVGGLREKAQVAARIIQAQEAERVRIAREIHDGPAQSMANIVLRAEICQKLYERGDGAKVMDELRGLRDAVRESLREVRRIIFNLRPMTLDDLGLGPTLRRYIEELNSRDEEPQIDLTVIGRERRLPQAVEVSAFRLIQEAVNNARRHAGAASIRVRVEFAPSALVIQVKDDGRGFDVAAVRSSGGSGHFGLLSMTERVELLAGSLQIDSSPGRGTTILARLPYEIE